MGAWKALLALMLGTVPDDKKAEAERLAQEVEAEMAKSTETSDKKTDAGGLSSDVLLDQVKQLTTEVQALKTTLAQERTEREKQQAAIADQAKQETAKRIDAAIAKGVEEGRIPAQNDEAKTTWKNLFESNFDAAEKALAATPSVKGTTTNQGKKEDGKGGTTTPATTTQTPEQILAAARAEFAASTN
ncbi:MAG TPA: hypothetical protein PLW14_09070 [Chlorobiota bacterium]|nr:hypothetical protein [Chlorobiota bacterium]